MVKMSFKYFVTAILLTLLLIGSVATIFRFKPVFAQEGGWLTIFTSDFEGTGSEWDGVVAQGNGASVSLNATHLPYAGMQHGEYNFSAGSNVGAYSYKTFGSDYYNMSFSAWYNMNNTGGWRKLVEFRSTSTWVFTLLYGYGTWRAWYYNTTGQSSEYSLSISMDTYQNITVEHFFNQTNGYHRVYINSTRILNLGNLNNTVQGGVHELRVGSPTQSDTYGSVCIRVDDVIVKTFLLTYTLTISATVGGATSPSVGSHVHYAGTTVSVTAIADANHVLDHWELDGSNVGSDNPTNVLMDGNHSLHAVFQILNYKLTILSSTEGNTNPSAGTYLYTNGTYVAVTATPNTYYALDYWLLDGNSAGSANPITVLMTANHTLQPVFARMNYTLTISTTTGGTTDPMPGTYTYSAGTIVAVSASVAPTTWAVTLVARLGTYTSTTILGVDSGATDGFDTAYDAVAAPQPPKGVYSYFWYPNNPSSPVDLQKLRKSIIPASGNMNWTLRVRPVGLEGTMVLNWTIMPPQYNGYIMDSTGTTILADMKQVTEYSYTAAMDVTITFTVNFAVSALPSSGYRFDHWVLDGSPAGTSNPIDVLMDSDHTLQAVFAETHTLTVSTSNGGTTSPVPGTYIYDEPANVSVTAISNANYYFDYWVYDGSNVGSQNPVTVYVGSSHHLHAVFSLINYTLIITTSVGGTTIPVPDTYMYASGFSVPVTAMPETIYVFDHWELDGVRLGSASPYSVLMDSDHTLHAVFMIHDLAVANITLSKTVVGQGYVMDINVTIANEGEYIETFNVTIYVNATVVGTQTISNLLYKEFIVLTFTFNTTGFAKGNYTMTAYATPVEGEIDIEDNNLTGEWVFVTIAGDVTSATPNVPEGRVDMRDIGAICNNFMTTPFSPDWDTNCDINGDGVVNMRDIGIACNNFMKT